MERCIRHSPGWEVRVTEFEIDVSDGPKKYDILELMRCNQLVAISTHGEANRQCWTSFTFGTRHRLDSVIKRLADADHGKVKVDYRMAIGLSGFRNHRLLPARLFTRALEMETTCGGKAEALGESAVRKRESASTRLGTCSSERGSCPWFGRTAASSTSARG